MLLNDEEIAFFILYLRSHRRCEGGNISNFQLAMLLDKCHIYPSKAIKTVLYPEVAEIISNFKIDPFFLDMNTTVRMESLKAHERSWRNWVRNGPCQINGLDNFPIFVPMSGTSQAFFRLFSREVQRGKKRVAFFPGEYTFYYHNCKRLGLEPILIPDEYDLDNFKGELEKAPDTTFAVLASPRSSTGLFDNHLNKIHQILAELNIPTYLDLSAIGTYPEGCIQTNFSNIKGVFSGTGKAFGTFHLRNGVYFARDVSEANIFAEEGVAGCFNSLSMEICDRLMEAFAPEYFPQKYQELQKTVCLKYDLFPGNVIHVGCARSPESKESMAALMGDKFVAMKDTQDFRVGIGDILAYLIYELECQETPFYLKQDYKYISSEKNDWYAWSNGEK